MQTRKDLYQAHRLMTQRVALALLQGRPSTAESPLRRTGVAAFCGVMVVVLIGAGFGIAGLIFKGGARGLERPGLLIIEEETGASYAYSARTGKMVPFLNAASARLAMPTTTIERKTVSRKSLARYGTGPMAGIPGAPESLPEQDDSRAPWSLCAHGGQVTLVGGHRVGGRRLRDTEAVLVRSGAHTWLIWRDRRMRVSSKAVRVLTAGGPVPVNGRWLNGLPQGPDFAAPDIPKWGTRVSGPDGRPARVGQVFRVAAVAGTGERWYVQLPDGLAGVSQTQARLLLESAGAGTRGPGPPREITPGAAGAHPSRTRLYSRDLPANPPKITTGRPLCAVYDDIGKLSTRAHFTVGGQLPAGSRGIALHGGGAFTGVLTAPGRAPKTFVLLTDQGTSHDIPTQDDAVKLGYSTKKAVPVPANLLRLFRRGPALTTTAARRPVPAN